MKRKYLLSALMLCGLMVTSCGETKTPDAEKPSVPESGETTPDNKPDEKPDTKPDETTKETVSKTVKFDLPDSHLKINDYNQDKKGHAGENKNLLKTDLFSDEIFDTTTFNIEGVFGPNNANAEKAFHNIKLGSRNGVGYIEVGLNKTLIDSIESIVLETVPHIRTMTYDQETQQNIKVFEQDRYKISIDGINYKEAAEVTGTCLADATTNKTTFTKEDCANLNGKLTFSNETLVSGKSARCYLKTFTINYLAK